MRGTIGPTSQGWSFCRQMWKWESIAFCILQPPPDCLGAGSGLAERQYELNELSDRRTVGEVVEHRQNRTQRSCLRSETGIACQWRAEGQAEGARAKPAHSGFHLGRVA